MPAPLSAARIKETARKYGFQACGLAPADALPAPYAEKVREWLASGQNATMDYLAQNLDKRLDPRLLVEGAKTIVSLAINYYTPPPDAAPDSYTLARYAQGQDYHDVVKQRLRLLMRDLDLTEHVDGRPFCDTAPVDERYWAVRCGIGWKGRNGQLIIPAAGSYFFLGELILTHPADHYDDPMTPRCGTCHQCLDACPTGALTGDGSLDARRCLSFLTIENRGPIPAEAAEKMGTCIYGCDRCAEACPWNRFAHPTTCPEFQPNADLRAMTPAAWQQLTIDRYRLLFKGSAVKRAKYEGLVRNIRAVAAAKEKKE